MNRAILGACLLLAASALPLAVSARRLVAAQALSDSAQTSLAQTTVEAREIGELRSKRETVQARPRPQNDVIDQVNAVLAEVGLPASSLKDLSTSSSAIHASSSTHASALREQSLQLMLKDLTPAQLGSWLLQWRKSQVIWSTKRLEIVHSRNSNQDPNHYDATIVLSALYLDDGSTPERP